MLQSEIRGKDRFAFMESIVVGDIGTLKSNQGTLTLFTNSSGGIIDDLIVNNTENYLYVVSNAGCRHKDIPLFLNTEKALKSDNKIVDYVQRDDLALLAVQGPKSQQVLHPLVNLDLSKMYFMNNASATIAGVPQCRVTRCGYTGEDGFEISVPGDRVAGALDELLGSSQAKVELAGLGARDSLRLEAGLCLYGNDMEEDTTPVEAALAWLIGKTRKERRDFPGAERILNQLKDKSIVKRKRVGFITKCGPPPRSHMKVLDAETNEEIGEVTSGCPSPSLGVNVAMGYVQTDSDPKIGKPVKIQVRNVQVEGEIAKMPFVKGKYYTPPKQ
jgi:aminomethyltransferase